MQSKSQIFIRGLRDGIPIALGYFAVSFALGIKAASAGITPLASAIMSLFNLTSAGEAAAIVLIGAGTTYLELAFTQLVINARYLLMSCSLSQKIAPETSIVHRMLISYGVTDEIFGISSAYEGRLSPYYSYGALCVAAPGWVLGTLFGALLGNVLPMSVNSALGVALYAMFLAIILPPAKKSRIIAMLVAMSMIASGILNLTCEYFDWTGFTEGFRIIVLTVVISFGAAVLFPVKEADENKSNEEGERE